MKQLDEYIVPTRGTIIGNPLSAPTDFLLSGLRRKNLFRTEELWFRKGEFDIAPYQSGPGMWSFYDAFAEESDGRLSLVGNGYRNALLRILPEGDGFIENENFADGVGALDESLKEGFIKEIPFSSAIMGIIDVVVDCATNDTEIFDRLITEQIEKIGDKIEELKLSDRGIYQVTEQGEGKIGLFPKDFFHEDGGDKKLDELGKKMRGFLGGLLPGGQEVPV